MNSITPAEIFNNPDFGIIRALEIDGEPYFVGKDVAVALEYDNPNKAVQMHVDDEDKKTIDFKGFSQNGNTSNLWSGNDFSNKTVITESGVYSLIFESRLPKARQFKRWITHDVIPSIRKHGAYATPATIENIINNPDFGIKLLQSLKEEQEKNRKLEEDNSRMRPKEVFADAVTASESSILVRDFAKILKQNGIDIGEKRLYKWLRENGYVIKNSTEPTQRAMELGLFERIERTIQRGDKPPITTSTTKITGKGQVYFTNKFMGGAANGR